MTHDPPAGVELRVCVASDLLTEVAFDAQLDLFRPPQRQRAALAEIAAEPGACVSVALAHEDGPLVVGYAAFHSSGTAASGSGGAADEVIELGALEVAPAYRRRGIASGLLHATCDGGRFDAAVVYARLYAWHYDLGRTGLGPLAYRRFLKRLYGGVGLQPVATTSAGDVADAHGTDLIMARRGPSASHASVSAFARRFGADLSEVATGA